jgi:nucleoside-diphosphate-sugar epimerase
MEANVFWKNQRVCVTGGAGFWGSFVVDKLKQLQADTGFCAEDRGIRPGQT